MSWAFFQITDQYFDTKSTSSDHGYPSSDLVVNPLSPLRPKLLPNDVDPMARDLR